MTRRLAVLVFAFAMAPFAHGEEGVFRGEIECVGPYRQHSELPPNSIHLDVKWDPLFKNSDVDLVLQGTHSKGTADLVWHQPGIPGGPEVPYISGSVFSNGQKMSLFFERSRDRIPEGGPIREGMLEIGDLFHNMQCHEVIDTSDRTPR